MSWSVGAIGKAPAVRKAIAEQCASAYCSEPEETVRKSAVATLDAALAAQGDSIIVKVSASGSQGQETKNDGTAQFKNSLSIQIEPQYNFVE